MSKWWLQFSQISYETQNQSSQHPYNPTSKDFINKIPFSNRIQIQNKKKRSWQVTIALCQRGKKHYSSSKLLLKPRHLLLKKSKNLHYTQYALISWTTGINFKKNGIENWPPRKRNQELPSLLHFTFTSTKEEWELLLSKNAC